jgi:glycosyltransferase involved in cell wall biosynthesis
VLANATALPETGRDAALYFDPTDSEELSREIRSLLEDRSLREGLIERGRERAGSLSWGATAAATEAVYRELL